MRFVLIFELIKKTHHLSCVHLLFLLFSVSTAPVTPIWRLPTSRLSPPAMVSAVLNSSTDAYANSTPHHGPPLWYEFEVCAVAPYSFIFYYGVKVLNLFVGAPCNVLVMWQIASKKSDATTSDTFFFNLAILDAYFCLMTPIELANRLFLGHPKIWHFQRFAYGVKDFAPVFLVSPGGLVMRCVTGQDIVW